jgi:hypothetical protein
MQPKALPDASHVVLLASQPPELRHKFLFIRNYLAVFRYSNTEWSQRDRNGSIQEREGENTPGERRNTETVLAKNVLDERRAGWSLHTQQLPCLQGSLSCLEVAENGASEPCFVDTGELNIAMEKPRSL